MSQRETPTPVPAIVPARMLNEFAYCPRLSYLMWVQQEWAENVETLEGKHAHRRVDRETGERAKVHDRSVQLTSTELGLTAVLDLIERDGRRARPVDYKRGKRPPVSGGAYEPERVQLCAQGLLLREHGYTSNEGLLYYAKSKERVRIRFTQALVDRTLELLAEMRRVLGRGTIPPPLEDSPKCPRCSLVSICLPEEVRFLRQGRSKPALALDLMEPFRPVLADGVVVGAINNGELQGGDFFEREGGVLLRPPVRKRLIAAYERRLAQKVRHPLFSYRLTYRRLFELEARLLARHLLGELPEYRPFEIR